jgi:V-type H+-transporting ATPase subunit D
VPGSLLPDSRGQVRRGRVPVLSGLCRGKVIEAVKRATIRLDKSEENIAGVLIPNLNLKEHEDADNAMSQIGLERGGYSIQKCREKFRLILDLLIQIASLQAAFLTLDEKIKVTNRRVNALEHVVIPRFINIYRYIEQELDEQAREDFFRLKKVLDNKKRHLEEAEKIAAQNMGVNEGGDKIESENLLDDVDEDIIF